MGRKLFLLGLVLFLATILRLYQLGKTPISLEWDEVALGYDAYSILKTGRDQFGQFMPITFRSLDDYKPPIYEYLTVPSVAVFGLTPFGVRLPSALAGILSVLVTYWLTKAVLNATTGISHVKTGILAAFLLAISPWHLQFSRAAFEVNVSVFITISAVAAFLTGLRKPNFFILSAVLFGLNLFSYHSARIVAPLLLVSLLLIFNRNLPARKYQLAFISIFALFFIFFIPILLSADAQIRFKATNIFNPGARYLNEKDLEKAFLDLRLTDTAAGFETAGKIFHNQRFIYSDYETLRKAWDHYISNFGFEFLFIKGDAPLHHAPGFGLLYICELPFLILGIIFLMKKGLTRYSLIIPLWLLFVPLPDAVTREAPHAVRSELFLPLFQILISAGMLALLEFVRKESGWVFYSFLTVLSIAFVANNSYYLHQYYAHTNHELSANWKYGREDAVVYTEKAKSYYDKILVSLNVDMPYIFWLFYTKYPPEKYLAEGGTVSGGFADERNHFDKFEFRNFDYKKFNNPGKYLFVGTPKDFPPDAEIVKRISYLDGTDAILIARR